MGSAAVSYTHLDVYKRQLVKGTAVLAAAGLFVKFLGAFFRIPLANMIGAVGMANYAPAYSLYNVLLVFSTAGVPVAVSKMVSERHAAGRYLSLIHIYVEMYQYLRHFGLDGIVVATKADKISRNQMPKQMKLIRQTLKLSCLLYTSTDRDNFMSADEAVQYGLIDQVIRDR